MPLTLPGHGAAPEDLIGVRAESWLDAVTAKYREVAGRHDTLHVMGMCLGGLLAVELCKRENHRKGRLVSLAAPCSSTAGARPGTAACATWSTAFPLADGMRVEEEEPYGLKNELVRSIVKAKFERGENFHYRWVPLSCVREVDRLRGWVMRGLDAIACPTLIMHAHEDELTSARSAHFLRDGIADSRLVLLDNSYHMICVDNDRDRVAAEVLRFMDRVAEASQPSRLQSLEGEDAQRLLSTYRESLRAGEFETLFPLFAENVVWTEEGDSPLSGVYRGKSALIDLFSRLMDYSRNTLRILEVGAPEPRGRAFAMPLRFQVQDGPGLQESGATHTLRLRANVITRVNSVADDPPRADALWRRLAAASGVAGGRRHGSADAGDPGRGTGRRLRGRHDRTAHAATAAIGRRANPAAGV